MPERLETFDEHGNKIGEIIKGQHTDDYVKCCTCFVVNNKNWSCKCLGLANYRI